MITLTTDFGHSDGYVGVMKGVILSIAPQVQIVDLSHGVPPQDICAGALLLEENCPFFPPGTIHVAVVDPGVGSRRAALAMQTDRAFYIGPDNGLFDLILKKEKLKQTVRLESPFHRLAAVSHTFHGRDIFAPAAAHLATGVPLSEFGPMHGELVHLELPHPCEHGENLRIHVMRVDHFGNLITDLTAETLDGWNPQKDPLRFEFTHTHFTGIVSTFAEVPEGSPLAYFSSSGRLAIAIRNGHAARYFMSSRGFSITLKNYNYESMQTSRRLIPRISNSF